MVEYIRNKSCRKEREEHRKIVMDIQKYMFKFQNRAQDRVYIVREKGEYGLICTPICYNDLPKKLSVDELQEQGGFFISRSQWEDIQANVCFAPDVDAAGKEYDTDCVTCNFYVLKEGRWGILDETGRMIQAPIYEDIVIVNGTEGYHRFEYAVFEDYTELDMGSINGRVLVRVGDKWGMIGGNGRIILPLLYEYIQTVEYYKAHSNVFIVHKGGLCGVVDRSGKFLIPMAYPSLQCDGLDYMWDCTVFRIDGEAGTGYVRLADGKCLVSPEWDKVDVDRLYLFGDAEPWGHIFTVWKENYCGVIYDDKGMIIPPLWDEIIIQRLPFENPLSYSLRRGEHWGCCDARGQMICEAIWDEVDAYYAGMVCVKKNGCWGAIDTNGHLRVPVEWDEIEGFGIKKGVEHEPTSLPIHLSWVRRKGLWGLIDKDGNIIVEPVWEDHDGCYACKYGSEWMELTVLTDGSNGETATNTIDDASGTSVGTTYRISIRKMDEGTQA